MQSFFVTSVRGNDDRDLPPLHIPWVCWAESVQALAEPVAHRYLSAGATQPLLGGGILERFQLQLSAISIREQHHERS